jgi:uncharacterized protein
MPRELTDLEDIRALLEQARTIAVLGAHPDASRAASYVPAYLRTAGYRIIPVNPRFKGQQMFGELTRETLAEIQEPVDIVDVFRPSEALALHLDDMRAMRPAPRAVWFQQGIENDEVALALIAAGIDVVQDRCTYIDHRRLAVQRIEAPRPG